MSQREHLASIPGWIIATTAPRGVAEIPRGETDRRVAELKFRERADRFLTLLEDDLSRFRQAFEAQAAADLLKDQLDKHTYSYESLPKLPDDLWQIRDDLAREHHPIMDQHVSERSLGWLGILVPLLSWADLLAGDYEDWRIVARRVPKSGGVSDLTASTDYQAQPAKPLGGSGKQQGEFNAPHADKLREANEVQTVLKETLRSSMEEELATTAHLLEELDQARTRSDVAGPEMASTFVRLHQMNLQFSLQYLELQAKIEGENREFAALSNIMRARHDAVKAAINSIR